MVKYKSSILGVLTQKTRDKIDAEITDEDSLESMVKVATQSTIELGATQCVGTVSQILSEAYKDVDSKDIQRATAEAFATFHNSALIGRYVDGDISIARKMFYNEVNPNVLLGLQRANGVAQKAVTFFKDTGRGIASAYVGFPSDEKGRPVANVQSANASVQYGWIVGAGTAFIASVAACVAAGPLGLFVPASLGACHLGKYIRRAYKRTNAKIR